MEAKLQEKQLREKEEEERQRRIAAKFKEKVKNCEQVSHISQDLSESLTERKQLIGKCLCLFVLHSGGQSGQQRPVQAYPSHEGMGRANETHRTFRRRTCVTDVSQV